MRKPLHKIISFSPLSVLSKNAKRVGELLRMVTSMMLVMVCGSLSSFNPGSAGVPNTEQRAGYPTQAVSYCQIERLDLGTYLPYPPR